MVSKWVREAICGRVRMPGGQLPLNHSLPFGETKAQIQGSPLLSALLYFRSNSCVYFHIRSLVGIIVWNGAVEHPLFAFRL